MNIKIQYNVANKSNIPNKLFLFRLINSVLFNKKNIYFLNIKIVNSREIKKLNLKFKGVNKSTNSLTFNMNLKIKKKTIVFGDIVICKSILEKEAKLYNKKINCHWSHIIIHSCLHIIGFDHVDDNQFEIIKNKEIEILKKFNISNPHIIY